MNGILLIKKEAGMTSHDVVNKLRRILQIKKIGHTGTLDPQATGVLVVLVGNACKVLPYLEDVKKEYVASIELGKKTVSDDIWGEILEEKEIIPIKNFKELVESMTGEMMQIPPMISSIKVNGKKLYEYARNHQEIKVKPRPIEIYEMEVLDEEKMQFRCLCSAGTYVRSICRDLSYQSGNLGCMSELIRTKVGRFTLNECVSLKQVEEGNFKLLPIIEVLNHYPQVELDDPKDILNGKHLRFDLPYDEVLFTHDKEALAIYKRHHGNVFACERGLW